VERADGFTGTNFTAIHPGTLPGDTTILDVGPDTENRIFNYRIKAIAKNQIDPFDQSATGSTVRLELKPASKKMELNWSASVPWSNQVQDFPEHLIYRGLEGGTENDLVLIGSVNVLEKGLVYIDSGQHNGIPLDDNTVYCYRVMTRGSYGNPKIAEPQENFSQIICAQPKDDIPPCKPELFVDIVSCEEFVEQAVCNFNAFSNTIYWNRPSDAECASDTRSYNVYFANQEGSEFLLLASNVRDTFYIDNNLVSFARCYKISAVDRSGNESDLSDAVCNDNCPYYELPNIFTPNGDNVNDVFSAFNVRDYQDCGVGEEGCEVPDYLKGRCARFVISVNFKVYNRWGTEVYTYSGNLSDDTKGIYIDWNGLDKNGNLLSSAVYFYVAEVTFDVVDPKKRVQNIKGWVHLIH